MHRCDLLTTARLSEAAFVFILYTSVLSAMLQEIARFSLCVLFTRSDSQTLKIKCLFLFLCILHRLNLMWEIAFLSESRHPQEQHHPSLPALISLTDDSVCEVVLVNQEGVGEAWGVGGGVKQTLNKAELPFIRSSCDSRNRSAHYKEF